MTIADATARWWSEHGKHLRDDSIEPNLNWLADNIGRDTFLHDITDDDVARLVELRRQDVRRAGVDDKGRQLYRPITNTTVNNSVPSLLRRVMRRAKENWNVSLSHEPIWKKHFLKQTRRHIREISPAEESTLDQADDPDFRDLRRFAIITGLRRREVLLTWPQVDFDNAIIRVFGKGGVPRIVPLSKEAYAILWSRRGQHAEFVFTFIAQRSRRCPHHKTLQKKGQRYPITYWGFGSRKSATWSKAGVNARLHDLRHTSAMRTLRATGNLKLVQKQLGHSDIATTARFYTDALVDDIRAAMELTAKASDPQLPAPAQNKDSENPV